MTTIRHRVLFALVITGIVPLTALLLLTDFMIGSAIRQSEEEKIANLNEAVAAHVSALMESAAEDLRAMQSNRFLSDPKVDSSERLQEMTRLVTVYDFISDLSVYDKKGFLMSSTTEDFPRYRDHSFTFKQAMEKREIEFSRPYREVGRADDQLFLSVYLPITNEESGALEHLVVARLNYSRVINLVQNVRPGSEGRIVLLDAWGNVLSSTNIKDSLAKFNDSLKVEKWVESPEGIYEDERGKRFLYHANVIGADKTQVQAPWVLVSLLPEEEINALLSRSQMGVLVVALGTLAMAGLIGWVISVRLSRPLVNLNEAAQKVAEGDLSVRAVAAGSVETTQLAGSFNQMVEELAEHRDGLERLVLSRTESLRRSQSELERTSARLQSAIDSTNNGFLVEDLEGGVAVVNQLFLDLIGFEGAKSSVQSAEAVLSIFGDHGEVLDGEFSSWNEARNNGEIIDCEVRLTVPEARILHVYSSPIQNRRGVIIGRVWNTQDLSEQRNLEDSLRQSQKMEAVGQLAGGIAHDFNNLLTGILGNLALVSLEMEKNPKSFSGEENLEFAIKAGERAAELVKQLLGFSRRSQMNLKACDSNHVLTEVRDILLATVDRRIKINLDLEPQPWKIMADLGLLSQVIINMAVNAKDAMPQGGNLYLRSENHKLDEDDAQSHAEALPGDYIRLTIEDDGEGIPLDVQKRIFEPFFTTKGQGKGTGLGLATSFGIIKQLGGWIEMDSTPGEGTRFEIFLPRSAAAEAQPSEEIEKKALIKPLERAMDKRETILIVDDEDVVRRVAQTLLVKLGYHVIEARDGLEAIELYEAHGDEIDLVLLDLTMPNLSGRETFSRLRADYPDVPVLICSGYLVDVNEFAEECSSVPNGFVQKPYHFEDMSDAVRRTLDGKQRAA